MIKPIDNLQSVELFSGGGGLALGVEMAGFRHRALVEASEAAIRTLRYNQQSGTWFRDASIIMDDIRAFEFSNIKGEIDLVAGGPPCQPFSGAGKRLGDGDSRDMFPATVDIVRRLRPNAFIIENVPGLTGGERGNYLEYLRLRLTYPDFVPPIDIDWRLTFPLLQKCQSAAVHSDLKYTVNVVWANAADYGVPQKRTRVFIIGFKVGQNIKWSFPLATYSEDRLLWDKWVTGEYWEKFNIKPPSKLSKKFSAESRIRKLKRETVERYSAWKTIREVISDMPEPARSKSRKFLQHERRDGAREYTGHTGSPIDDPAKTIKAGVHGVPGGENMIRFSSDRIRYMTIREAARLQGFPDDYRFSGSWSQVMMQIGNAVPVDLAVQIAESVKQAILNSRIRGIAANE